MSQQEIKYFEVNSKIKLAYQHISGKQPGVMFCSGYMSDMNGTKAEAIVEFCREHGHAYTRFDYRAHGLSSGEILEATISHWRDDALAIFDKFTNGPQILVGSSMGGWIALLVALARPERVCGLVGIAAAPDFTEDLLWQKLSSEQQEKFLQEKVFYEANEYGDKPYAFPLQLIKDARQYLLLRQSIPLTIPVRLLHGMNDHDVPWQTSLRIAEKLQTENVRATFIKDGDHRLSRDQDLLLLKQTLQELICK